MSANWVKTSRMQAWYNFQSGVDVLSIIDIVFSPCDQVPHFQYQAWCNFFKIAFILFVVIDI